MTIDTTSWYHAAYVWVSALYLAYFASLAIRARAARKRLAQAGQRPAR